jgi:uncharacterized protein YbcI
VSAFQQRQTGYAPKAVTVVLSEDTVVVTLHEALSPAEKALARTPEAAIFTGLLIGLCGFAIIGSGSRA